MHAVTQRSASAGGAGVPLAGRLGAWTAAWRDGSGLGSRIVQEMPFGSLAELLPRLDRPAIGDGSASDRDPLSYAELHRLVEGGAGLTGLGLRPGERCALALPEGPELAVCLLVLSARCVVVPMNPWSPEGEIAGDLSRTGARAVVVGAGEDFEHIRRAARAHGVAIVELVPGSDVAGRFDLTRLEAGGDHPVPSPGRGPVAPGRDRTAGCNGPDDVALELFTSGTSGRKKLVPIRLADLCVGAACIAAALELGPGDRGYNMMPLFHVGGIVRNLFAPLLAGSEMVYSSGFDAGMFWDELERGGGFNWYYASPTMHEAVLREGERRPAVAPRLRFICNAAGALLPSTAQALSDRFGAAILPGYGMTECMPIAIPPLSYRLERTGASGRILGPEVAILDAEGVPVEAGTAGRIVLRGAPVAIVEQEPPGPGDPVVPEGWFDTGDLGRFDADGYLYIVGRGKDVIKRGGETIAPAEIEDVIVRHPDVGSALAFAIPHEALGETVGCVIVPRAGRRVDLDGLAPHLRQHLAPAKWPVLLVYMDDLPKTATNKLMRVRLASRLGIDGVDETTPVRARLLEASCPAKGTPIAEPITARPVEVGPAQVEAAIRRACPEATDVLAEAGPGRTGVRVAVQGLTIDERILKARLRASIHDYLIPPTVVALDVFPRRPDSSEVDREALWAATVAAPAAPSPADELEAHILAQWRERLGEDRDVRLDSDFFDDLGGGSLTAVQIIADLRDRYGIALAPTAIFRARTVRGLAKAVRAAMVAPDAAVAQGEPETRPRPAGPPARSQTRPAALIAQLLPLGVLPTVVRVAQFGMWMVLWWSLVRLSGQHGLVVMFVALSAAGALKQTLAPLAAIAFKWLLIGRYRTGAVPLWGHRYLRWWLVRQVQVGVGLGVFALSYPLTALYLRLMGAKVGRRTRISPEADLGEFDLLTIGDAVAIDESATVRPFVLADGAADFRPIRLGRHVSIGTRATVVPGSVLPAHVEIAPLGSSDDPAAREGGTRSLSRGLVYDPPIALKGLGTLIRTGLVLVSFVPLVLVIHSLISFTLVGSHLAGPVDLLIRMAEPQRLLRSSVLLVASTLTTPFIYLAGVIVVKWVVIGRFSAEDDLSRPWPRFERWLMWRLLPDGRFGGVAPLLGSNFGAISVIYRLLGAKVGRRIYWPGSGNVITEYDLFECGDDVTFGSRSTYLMSSRNGSAPIRIEAGANVADRCVLAPGVVVGQNAVLGSGTFAPAGFAAPAGSTWIGQDGRRGPIELEAATPRRAQAPTLRPYARAMYLGEASYRVWPLGAHIAFNLVLAVAFALYRAAPMIAALTLTRTIAMSGGPGVSSLPVLLVLLALIYLPLNLLSALGSLGIVIATKWLIIGRRTEGEHLWTDSSYCQRWKLHTQITSIIRGWLGRDILAFLEGSAYLVWYFRALGARIGANVCLYPNGADPMMEEADLLHIGDDALVDQAVLIAHLNTRGEWTMGPIHIGAGACLRAASRVMMMSTVGDGSTLLENTLVLAGDASRPASTWSGWPGEAVRPETADVVPERRVA